MALLKDLGWEEVRRLRRGMRIFEWIGFEGLDDGGRIGWCRRRYGFDRWTVGEQERRTWFSKRCRIMASED